MTHNDNPQTVPEVQEEALQEGQDNNQVAGEALDAESEKAPAPAPADNADANADAPA